MCFTVLNITYKAILKHPKFPIVKKHILEKLNEIAFIPGKSPESNFSKVFSNEMVIDKFILFIGTYSDGLFYDIRIDENGVVIEFITDENSKKLCHALEYLFNCLNYFEKAPGIAYQASNTIKSLFENPKGKNLIKEFLNSKISQMILLIEEIQIVLFFDILESVEASIVDVTHVYSMVKALVKRILKEIKSNKHDDQKINIYISKCFNILESIIKRHVGNDNSAKIPVIKMEEEIKEIILYIKNPNRIDFEDDILRLTYRLLEKSQDITDSSKLVFDCLNRVICNHGCIKRETFDFLYQIISKKNKEFLESPNIQKDLRDIVLFKEDEDDYTSVYTSMLMQIWVLVSLLI